MATDVGPRLDASTLRFVARTAGFVALTFSLYGALEVDTAMSPAADRDTVLYKWIQRYGRGLLALYGVDVIARGPYVERGERYPGTDAEGRGRLFVMNHRSGLDIPITLAFIEATIVSRADLAHWPVIGVAARRVGTLFVDRSDKKSGSAVITAMVVALRRGRAVMVYPEGTTFAGDDVRPFKPGAFVAALRARAEIVPVGLAYGAQGTSFVDEPFAAHMRRVAGQERVRAAFVVGEPIRADRHGHDADAGAIGAEARAAVQKLVRQARGLVGA